MADKWTHVHSFYVLDGHEVRQVDDVLTWARQFKFDKRRVAFTDLGWATVSTVFLGVDHRHFGEGPPVLFETMVFGNPKTGETFPEELDGLMNRYTTWDEAEAGHAEIVAEVRAKFWQRSSGGAK